MHGFANPKRFLEIARWLTPLLLVSGLIITAAALVWGYFMVPPDRLMGDTVRSLFLHVPSALLGMGGWTAIAISSLMFLVWRHPLAGLAARGAADGDRRRAASAIGQSRAFSASRSAGTTACTSPTMP